MQKENELIPHLFRTEFRKITSVLCKTFGIQNIEIAEDLVSDTFLKAAETWGSKGIPSNPTAWLYTVSKNKATDYFRRHQLYNNKIAPELKHTSESSESPLDEIDLSDQNIQDSQLQMMFAICHPSIPMESQIGLSLRILCGFGIDEIVEAFLSKKDTINKRLFRAKEKLRKENIKMEFPAENEIDSRLNAVLRTLYLLFNEGYYSATQNTTLRKDLCMEAMRLNLLLLKNKTTNRPNVNALLALMCFHASRFEARVDQQGELILYEDQDTSLWNRELISQGEHYMNAAAIGQSISKYHLEAAIAYWHTQPDDSFEKWENILQFYNRLLQIEYSPMAALNRTYALSKASGKKVAIREAEKLNLKNSHLYYSLLGELYINIDNQKALENLKKALDLIKTEADKKLITKKIQLLKLS